MSENLPNLAEGLASASEVAHIAEGLHYQLSRAGREYNLGLPATFGLEWNDTPVPHQLALVSAAGEVMGHMVEHLTPPGGGPLSPEQHARAAALAVAVQALPPSKGVLGATLVPRYLDLLQVAQWVTVGGDPLGRDEDDDGDVVEDEGEQPAEPDAVDLREHDTP